MNRLLLASAGMLLAAAMLAACPGERDTTPPALLSIIPPDGAASVPIDTAIVIRFNETPAGETVNDARVRLEDASGVDVQKGIDVNGELVTLDPADDLMPGTDYTVTVAPGIEDEEGNATTSTTTATFTTAAAD